jgi:hypothetical protein
MVQEKSPVERASVSSGLMAFWGAFAAVSAFLTF